MNPFHTSSPLQAILAAPATSLTSQHTYRYASSQELIPGTHQDSFHYREEI